MALTTDHQPDYHAPMSRFPYPAKYLPMTADDKKYNARHAVVEMDTRAMPVKDRTVLIQGLIAKGMGDGSIAVRLNNQGIECSRADVHKVRTGRAPPDYSGIDD